MENSSSSSSLRVCVTGGSGYIASWVVKLLLEQGYTVHATVRSLNPAKTEHLVRFDGAKERLHLFEANLMVEGSFDSAIQGCDGVFHIASPVMVNSSNPQVDVIDPAVKGTLNVLNSCAKVGSIKRVVLTSSIAAVTFGERPITHDSVVDETWFSSLEGCEHVPHNAKWYILSKTWAEEAAWKFTKEKGIDMVTINPGIVIGPFFPPSLNYGALLLLDLVNEPEKYPDLAATCLYEGWVHIKDVAEAHIRAFEIPTANGRYILVENVAYCSQVVNILEDLYPTLDFSNKCIEKVGVTYTFSKEKATTLGINFILIKDAIKESVEFLKDNNFINV